MMRKMRVAAVQFKRGQLEHNQAIEQLGRWAARGACDADLVVLPEMAATGYVFEDLAAVSVVAEEATGATFQRLAPIARIARCWIVAGFPERELDRVFNSAMVIDPTGELAFTYRKTLLYDAEVGWATPGDSGYRFFDTDQGRFTVGICMDLNDDAFVQWCGKCNASVLAFPTNWVQEEEDVWNYWAWRLSNLQCALVAANTHGKEGSLTFSGRSLVLKNREVLAAAPVLGNSVVWADLDG